MKPKLVLLFLLLLCALPPVAATLLFFFAPPEGTTNRGELLEPAQLTSELFPEDDEIESSSVWHLAAVGSYSCDPACAARLCAIQQARRARLGDLPRIRLLWLASGAGHTPSQLMHEPSCGRDLQAGRVQALDPIDVLANVQVVAASDKQLAGLPAPAQGADVDGYLYIIDPQGRVMMRYPQDVAIADIAKDLARLLKLSQRG